MVGTKPPGHVNRGLCSESALEVGDQGDEDRLHGVVVMLHLGLLTGFGQFGVCPGLPFPGWGNRNTKLSEENMGNYMLVYPP